MKTKGSVLILVSTITFIFLFSGCFQPEPENRANRTDQIVNQTEKAEPIDELIFLAKVEVTSSGPPYIVSSKTVLDFGKLPYNMVERKEILIINNRDFTVIAVPSANGSISKWITFDEDRIIIEPKSKNTSIVSIKIPPDTKTGNYSGYVIYSIYKS